MYCNAFRIMGLPRAGGTADNVALETVYALSTMKLYNFKWFNIEACNQASTKRRS